MNMRIPFIILSILLIGILGRNLRKKQDKTINPIMQVRTAGEEEIPSEGLEPQGITQSIPPQAPETPVATTIPSEGAKFELVPGATTYRLAGNQQVERTIKQGNTSWKGVTQFRQGALQRKASTIVAGGIIIDMETMQLEQSNSSGSLNFQSNDFFATSEFPTASFILQEIGDGKIVGVLTMKGISNQISFPAVIINEDEQTIVISTLSIDGRKRSVLGKDQSFSNFIQLSFTLRFTR